MARIQRKKKQKAKKKNQSSAEGTASQGVTNDAVAKKTDVLPGSVKSIKAKSYSTRQKSLTKTEPGKLKGYIDKGLQFLREVKVELKKVVWPSRKQTIGSTVVVLILTMIISVFLGLVDIGLSSLIRVVLK
jgi:preprotein translocase subunit SecE